MPDINTPTVIASSRQPRGAIKLNGTIIAGWESWEVENNAFRAADTFSATFIVGALPTGFGAAWFGTQTEIDCEIFATDSPANPENYQPAASDRLIFGQVDDLEFDPVAGTLSIHGRDLTARMIDNKISINNLNQTSSQIATQIAANHGLTPVITATTTKVGTVYSQNASSLKQDRSEWDILTELATYENFDVFVVGAELHFQPKPVDSGARYALVWTPPTVVDGYPQVNATALHFDRSLTIAKGVSVTVRSWNSGKVGKTFSASYPRSSPAIRVGGSGSSSPLHYLFTKPGKTQDWCQQFAMQMYKQITAHMVKLSADMPGDSLLTCTNIMQVRGTGTAWDQDYFPDTVKRSMSMDEGYRMSVTAKNISQDLDATIEGGGS